MKTFKWHLDLSQNQRGCAPLPDKPLQREQTAGLRALSSALQMRCVVYARGGGIHPSFMSTEAEDIL